MEKKRAGLIIAVIIGLLGLGYTHTKVYRVTRDAYQSYRDAYQADKVEINYYKQAECLNDYYGRFNVSTRVSVIRKTLKAIDRYLPKYFPKGPYERKDIIAIAMVESSFNQYLTGSKGEYGIFQIMPESSKWMGVEKNQFDIEVNTELALFVLKKKFEEHKDYKMGIIAYNGVVKSRGKISEKYWEQFIKYRRATDDILRVNNTSTTK